jgi:hypothetical protein
MPPVSYMPFLIQVYSYSQRQAAYCQKLTAPTKRLCDIRQGQTAFLRTQQHNSITELYAGPQDTSRVGNRFNYNFMEQS